MIQKQTATVFLNGIQCGKPVDLGFELKKCGIYPGILSIGHCGRNRFEYERILHFPLRKERPP